MAMRKSLIASLALHAGLMAAALLPVMHSAPPMPRPDPITVNIVQASELTQVKAGSRAGAKEDETTVIEAADEDDVAAEPMSAASAESTEKANQLENAEAAPQTQAALPPPPDTVPVATKPVNPPPAARDEVAAKSVPVPTRAIRPAPPQTQAGAANAPRTQPEPRPPVTPPASNPPPRQRQETAERFDPDRIAALLNRDPNAVATPRTDESSQRQPWRRPRSLDEQASGIGDERQPRRRIAYGQPDGRDTRMSASEIDAFRAQISRCWTPPAGGIGSGEIVVRLRIGLKPDGTLAHQPQLANRIDSPFFRPAAESAVRAVMQCQPYAMPPEKFDQWRDMLLTFDPRHMFGG